jgi:hypothetical protein
MRNRRCRGCGGGRERSDPIREPEALMWWWNRSRRDRVVLARAEGETCERQDAGSMMAETSDESREPLMTKDQPLDAWLAEVRQADLEVEAPPGLEARTLAAWQVWRREYNRSSSRPSRVWLRARWWRVPAFVGLAAALLVGLMVLRTGSDAEPGRRRSDREDQTADSRRPDAINEVSSGLPVAPVVRESGERDARPVSSASSRRPRERSVTPRTAQRPDAVSRARPVVAPPTVETASFVALGPDVERELTGTFQIARVRVSRDVLIDLGLLQEGYRGGEPLQADVVFGEDGLARAIRLTPVAVMSGRIP